MKSMNSNEKVNISPETSSGTYYDSPSIEKLLVVVDKYLNSNN